MCEERAKTRCVQCELVQWADHANCRRCGQALPVPVVNVIERVVEKVIVRRDAECLATLEEAQKLIATASERLSLKPVEPLSLFPATAAFPSMAEVERAMIVAAYRKSSRKPVEAARLLGIGRTTFYRKLRQIRGITV